MIEVVGFHVDEMPERGRFSQIISKNEIMINNVDKHISIAILILL